MFKRNKKSDLLDPSGGRNLGLVFHVLIASRRSQLPPQLKYRSVWTALKLSTKVNHLPSVNLVRPHPNPYCHFTSLTAVGKSSAEKDKLASRSQAILHHSTEQIMCTTSLIISEITAGAQTGRKTQGRLQLSIHPPSSSSKSLPLPANENEVIVTYLFRWLCLLRREDTKLSSFEVDVHQGNTVVVLLYMYIYFFIH